MENGIKPSTIMLIAGGAVMFISTFLDWFSISVDTGIGSISSSANGWETDAFGLLGIFVALIGLVLGGGVALTTFANVNLPDSMLGFTRHQIHVVLAETAFIITLGLLFRGDVGVGLILALIASGVAAAGAFMEMQSESGAPAPPTQF